MPEIKTNYTYSTLATEVNIPFKKTPEYNSIIKASRIGTVLLLGGMALTITLIVIYRFQPDLLPYSIYQTLMYGSIFASLIVEWIGVVMAMSTDDIEPLQRNPLSKEAAVKALDVMDQELDSYIDCAIELKEDAEAKNLRDLTNKALLKSKIEIAKLKENLSA